MAQSGIAHASDALAEWVLNNGQESTVLKKSWEKSEEVLNKLLVDSHSLANVSDAGAHGKLFCEAGYNVFLLTDYVRDRGVISIEQGVHMLTGRLSNFFGLNDRGTIELGKVADITVFNLDEIEMRPERKTFDVWDGTGGTYRYTGDPVPCGDAGCWGAGVYDGGLPGAIRANLSARNARLKT